MTSVTEQSTVNDGFSFEVDMASYAQLKDVDGAMTKIDYSYTDAGGWGQTGIALIQGVVNLDVLAHLNNNLWDREFILPSQLGMPTLQEDEYDEELDHEMHLIESITYITEKPEDRVPEISLKRFTTSVMKLKGEDSWDIVKARGW